MPWQTGVRKSHVSSEAECQRRALNPQEYSHFMARHPISPWKSQGAKQNTRHAPPHPQGTSDLLTYHQPERLWEPGALQLQLWLPGERQASGPLCGLLAAQIWVRGVSVWCEYWQMRASPTVCHSLTGLQWWDKAILCGPLGSCRKAHRHKKGNTLFQITIHRCISNAKMLLAGKKKKKKKHSKGLVSLKGSQGV